MTNLYYSKGFSTAYRQPVEGPPVELGTGSLGYHAENSYDHTRRPKPSDLFAAGTQQNASRVDETVGSIVFSTPSGVCSGPMSYFAGGYLNKGSDLRPPMSVADGSMRQKIKNENFNLAQSLSEYRQTSTMFVDLARDMFYAFHSLRRGRPTESFLRLLGRIPGDKTSKFLANKWLQYQFGIKPLISDIYGAAEALGSRLQGGYSICMRTSHNLNQVLSSPRSVSEWGLSGHENETYSCRTTCQARYTISEPGLKSLSQVGITNPALLVWELMPYSFVIDWMIPVGDWLASLDALSGVSDLQVIRTQKVTSLITVDMAGSRSTLRQEIYSRSVPTSDLAMPSLAYKPSNSLTAVLNGLALLRQLR